MGETAVSPKEQLYRELEQDVVSVLDGERDPIVWMTTLSCLVRDKMGFFWVGFYRVRGVELVIGPYQGSLGCLRIPFDRGVCGACATERRTIIVPDVHAFPGHIACDSRSRSEIVVPVFDETDGLQAVFDLDSDQPATFDTVDQFHLERLVARMRSLTWSRLDSVS